MLETKDPFHENVNFPWYYHVLQETMACGRTLEICIGPGIMAPRLAIDKIPTNSTRIRGASDLRHFESKSFQNVISVHALDLLPPKEAERAIAEIARICSDRLFLIVSSPQYPHQQRTKAKCLKPRIWWEQHFFRHGFQRIANATRLLSPDACLRSQFKTVILLEACNANESESKRIQTSHEPDDIATADQYAFCAELIRPNDRVLHLNEEPKQTTSIFYDLSRCHSVSILNDKDIPKGEKFDFTVAHALPKPPLVVPSEFNRLKDCLKPGGRLLTIWQQPDQSSSDSALQTFEEISKALASEFLVEEIHYQLVDEERPAISDIKKLAKKAEFESIGPGKKTLIFVCMKDPRKPSSCTYKETVFPNNESLDRNPFSYAKHYENPWLVHSMVTFGFRCRSTERLDELADSTIDSSPANSADYGAALCVKTYRLAKLMSKTDDAELPSLVQKIDQYCKTTTLNPHSLRWKISLRFALANLYANRGDFDNALAQLKKCVRYDPFQFAPHLATKTAESHFMIGWIHLFKGDREDAHKAWKRGTRFGDRLLKADMKSILVDPNNPNRFDVGDGMREFILALEHVALCVNGLNFLKQKKRRPYGLGEIWNAFHVDRRLARQEFKNENDEILAKEGKHRLPSLIAKLKLKGCRTIAIYGAGAIGAYLAQHLPGAGIQISTLIDSFAKEGQTSGPFTVVLPKEAPALSLDAVVIASDAFKEVMTQSLQTAYKQANKPLPHLFQW